MDDEENFGQNEKEDAQDQVERMADRDLYDD